MRILYLHQYFVPPSVHGGTRSYEFAKRLIAYGHEVTLVTSSAMLPEKYQNLQKITQDIIAGISVIIIPVPYSNNLNFTQRLIAFLKFAFLSCPISMHQQADIIFATSTPLTIALPALASHFWQRIPMVFEVRDLWPDVPIAMGVLSNPMVKALAYGLERFTYHHAAHIVALSPGMAQGIMAKGIAEDRITVIPNASDTDLFEVPQENGEHIREKLKLQTQQPLVVYAGTFGFVNDVRYIVYVAKEMLTIDPNVAFLLVGKGIEYELVRQEAIQHNVLEQNLWLWEPVPKSELPNILAAAKVGVSTVAPIPALFHNSANKVFDSLAAGKPIVINHGGWMADFIEETGAGLVLPSNDFSRAARMLAEFLQDTDRYTKATEAARHLSRTRFSRDVLAKQLATVLGSQTSYQSP